MPRRRQTERSGSSAIRRSEKPLPIPAAGNGLRSYRRLRPLSGTDRFQPFRSPGARAPGVSETFMQNQPSFEQKGATLHWIPRPLHQSTPRFSTMVVDHRCAVLGSVLGGLARPRQREPNDEQREENFYDSHIYELPRVFINDHGPVLTADEQPVVWRIGDDVVPTAVSAERVCVSDAVAQG
jgi:hypothetical protein